MSSPEQQRLEQVQAVQTAVEESESRAPLWPVRVLLLSSTFAHVCRANESHSPLEFGIVGDTELKTVGDTPTGYVLICACSFNLLAMLFDCS